MFFVVFAVVGVTGIAFAGFFLIGRFVFIVAALWLGAHGSDLEDSCRQLRRLPLVPLRTHIGPTMGPSRC